MITAADNWIANARRACPAQPSETDAEDDGLVTIHPQVDMHRGAAPENFDIRALRDLIEETAGLEADDTADNHAAFWRELATKGEVWTPCTGRRAVALYGIVADGANDATAARNWLDSARRHAYPAARTGA